MVIAEVRTVRNSLPASALQHGATAASSVRTSSYWQLVQCTGNVETFAMRARMCHAATTNNCDINSILTHLCSIFAFDPFTEASRIFRGLLVGRWHVSTCREPVCVPSAVRGSEERRIRGCPRRRARCRRVLVVFSRTPRDSSMRSAV